VCIPVFYKYFLTVNNFYFIKYDTLDINVSPRTSIKNQSIKNLIWFTGPKIRYNPLNRAMSPNIRGSHNIFEL